MFTAGKFGRKLPAVVINDSDSELLSRVNAELQLYIDNMDHVKYAAFYMCNVFVFTDS